MKRPFASCRLGVYAAILPAFLLGCLMPAITRAGEAQKEEDAKSEPVKMRTCECRYLSPTVVMTRYSSDDAAEGSDVLCQLAVFQDAGKPRKVIDITGAEPVLMGQQVRALVRRGKEKTTIDIVDAELANVGHVEVNRVLGPCYFWKEGFVALEPRGVHAVKSPYSFTFFDTKGTEIKRESVADLDLVSATISANGCFLVTARGPDGSQACVYAENGEKKFAHKLNKGQMLVDALLSPNDKAVVLLVGDEKTVGLAGSKFSVIGLDIDTKKTLWDRKVSSVASVKYWPDSSKLSVSSRAEGVMVLEADSGKPVWTSEAGFFGKNGCVIGRAALYFIDARASADGKRKWFVVGLDAKTGKELARVEFSNQLANNDPSNLPMGLYEGPREGAVMVLFSDSVLVCDIPVKAQEGAQ